MVHLIATSEAREADTQPLSQDDTLKTVSTTQDATVQDSTVVSISSQVQIAEAVQNDKNTSESEVAPESNAAPEESDALPVAQDETSLSGNCIIKKCK
jgi:hypothetical protein